MTSAKTKALERKFAAGFARFSAVYSRFVNCSVIRSGLSAKTAIGEPEFGPRSFLRFYAETPISGRCPKASLGSATPRRAKR